MFLVHNSGWAVSGFGTLDIQIQRGAQRHSSLVPQILPEYQWWDGLVSDGETKTEEVLQITFCLIVFVLLQGAAEDSFNFPKNG